MNLLTDLYTSPLTHSIGWTLIHACWQISLIAILLKVALIPLEKQSAKFAYTLSVIGLFIIFIWAGFTFSQQYAYFNQIEISATTETNHISSPQNSDGSNNSVLIEEASSTTITSNWDKGLYTLECYLPFFVSLWIVGVLLFTCRFIGGWLHIKRLKTIGLEEISTEWLNRLEKLKLKIGVSEKVGFHFSSLVNEPITVGHLKPIILVPLGMFSNLTPEMAEAVLLHELAHIKRSDFLINALQSVIEIAFFFHPAIWWMGQKIRQTREHACDDLAVAACEDRILYAKTLTEIQSSYFSKSNNLAMTLSGKSGSFTTRVKRLFGYKETSNKKGNVLFASLLFTSLLFLAFVNPFFEKQTKHTAWDVTTKSDAMLFVITPNTTKTQLEKIKEAFSYENVLLDYEYTKITPAGLLKEITLSITMPTKGGTSTFEVIDLESLTISLDWNRKTPLDVRYIGEYATSTICVTKFTDFHLAPEEFNSSRRDFDTPSLAGNIGFQKNELIDANTLIVTFPKGESPLLFLNGNEISKSDLLAKKLTAEQVASIQKLSTAVVNKKYRKSSPFGAYEIYTQEISLSTIFDPVPFDTIIIRKVKLETEDLKPAPLCFLNGKKMAVNNFGEWPAKIIALAQYDSIMMISGKSALTNYGEEGKNEVWHFYNTMELLRSKDIWAGTMLYVINGEMIPAETSELEKVVKDKIGSDKVISHCLYFGTSATDLYGDIGKKGVKTITTQEEEPTLTDLAKNKEYYIGERLYIVDGEMIFPNTPDLENVLMKKLANKEIDKTDDMEGRVPQDPYGDLGKNGVRIIKTKKNKRTVLAESFKVYPNPIKDNCTIDFLLSTITDVNILLYNSGGQLVKVIYEERKPIGQHRINWSPDNLPNGIYHLRIQTERESFTKPIVIQKIL